MKTKSLLIQLINNAKRFIGRVEKKLERDIINLLLIILLATAFVLKIEVVFLELTIQVPLIILGGVLYGGYYYFIVASPQILPKNLRRKELQTRIALSALSMSTIVADVLIHDFLIPISYVKLWLAIWVVIGAEALVELLAYVKNSSKKSPAKRVRPAKRNRKNQLVNRLPQKRKLPKDNSQESGNNPKPSNAHLPSADIQ